MWNSRKFWSRPCTLQSAKYLFVKYISILRRAVYVLSSQWPSEVGWAEITQWALWLNEWILQTAKGQCKTHKKPYRVKYKKISQHKRRSCWFQNLSTTFLQSQAQLALKSSQPTLVLVPHYAIKILSKNISRLLGNFTTRAHSVVLSYFISLWRSKCCHPWSTKPELSWLELRFRLLSACSLSFLPSWWRSSFSACSYISTRRGKPTISLWSCCW